jgi:hypothetical protein
MPNVRLNVTEFAKKGNKWTNAVGSDGKTYSYKYTGGNGEDNNGDQDFLADGNQEQFDIIFQGGVTTYEFVSFRDKGGAGELQGVVSANHDEVAVTDFCNTPGTFFYGVEIRNTITGVTIECDPMIRNR